MPALLPVYKRSEITFARGEGAYLFDRAGRRYLDFGSGIAVTLLGHAHPHLVAVLEAQGRKLWHCSNLYGIEPHQRLAERLVALSFADTAFFCNSGAEANVSTRSPTDRKRRPSASRNEASSSTTKTIGSAVLLISRDVGGRWITMQSPGMVAG